MTRVDASRRGRKAVSAMPLDYAEFAHHYQGSGLGEHEQREQFEAFADIMECLFRALCLQPWTENRLGIRLDGDVLALTSTVDSSHATPRIFNMAASENAPERSIDEKQD